MEQEAQPGRGWRDLLWKEATNALAQRLEIHYTPKHASWLNIAEI